MILILAAHSDDEVLGCGGTIAKYADEGEDVVSIIFSEGDPINPKNYTKENKNIAIQRRKESIAAGKVLGINDTVFLGLSHNPFMSNEDLAHINKRISKIIIKLKPRIIFTHVPDDPHPGHAMVAKLAKKIADKHDISLYTFMISNPLKIQYRDKPRLYVDITDTINKKRKALKQFKSQEHWLIYYKIIAYFMDKISGLQSNHSYAEVFYKW